MVAVPRVRRGRAPALPRAVGRAGQSTVEFALVLPLVITVLLLVVQVVVVVRARLLLEQALHEAARVAALDADRLLDRLLDGLDDDERWLLTRVDGLGHQINEIAGEYGVVRETLSKRLSKIRSRVQANREQMENEGVIPTTITETPALVAGSARRGRPV